MNLHQKTSHHAGDNNAQIIEHNVQEFTSKLKHPLSEEDHRVTDILEPTSSEETSINKLSDVSDHVQKTFSCEQCDKSFETMQACESHIKMVHQCEKLFRCTICNKNFTQQLALKAHMSIHEVSNKKFRNFCIHKYDKMFLLCFRKINWRKNILAIFVEKF